MRMQETIGDAKHVRSSRRKLFLILSAFFFVEGLGILASPILAQRVCHLPSSHVLCSIKCPIQVCSGRRGLFLIVGLPFHGGPGHPGIAPLHGE